MMVNLTNQRPGDLWVIGEEKYEVRTANRDEFATYLLCKRVSDGGIAVISITVDA